MPFACGKPKETAVLSVALAVFYFFFTTFNIPNKISKLFFELAPSLMLLIKLFAF